jgi:hypothetical protein
MNGRDRCGIVMLQVAGNRGLGGRTATGRKTRVGLCAEVLLSSGLSRYNLYMLE